MAVPDAFSHWPAETHRSNFLSGLNWQQRSRGAPMTKKLDQATTLTACVLMQLASVSGRLSL